MKNHKSFIFNNCKLAIKLFPLIICGFFLLNCQEKTTGQIALPENQYTTSVSVININDASQQELEKLPHIGSKIARDIVEFREKYGKFTRAEQLLLIDDISDNHFREMRNLIKTE